MVRYSIPTTTEAPTKPPTEPITEAPTEKPTECRQMETILEKICKPVTKQVCQNKPEEKCHKKMIEVCNDVEEEICEEKKVNFCQQVSKQECPKPVESCRTEQKCETITEKKCSKTNKTPSEDDSSCKASWLKLKCSGHCKHEPAHCTPWVREQCIKCNFLPKCWDTISFVKGS